MSGKITHPIIEPDRLGLAGIIDYHCIQIAVAVQITQGHIPAITCAKSGCKWMSAETARAIV